MSRGINKVILIGNIGKDPEIKYTKDQFAITNFSIATSESWKDKTSGDTVEKTEWHNITMFGKLAEIASQYVKKGQRLYIEGKLKTDKFKDKDGIERYKTSIIANEMQILSSKDKKDENCSQDIKWSNQNTNNLDNDFNDDEIPF